MVITEKLQLLLSSIIGGGRSECVCVYISVCACKYVYA